MTKLRKYIPVVLFFLLSTYAQGQKDPTLKPLLNRALFHVYVDREQQTALRSDGKDDKEFTVSDNPDINIHVTSALIGKINELQKKIEHDSVIEIGRAHV